jgi:serine protease Do
MVVDVIKRAPSWKAGIRPGDIIVFYKKHRIYNSAILKHLVSITPPGKTVNLEILRRGHKKKISVQIGLQNDVERTYRQNLKKYLGIIVTTFPTSAVRINKPRKGVIISWIDPNGPMGEAGFEARDIILEANGHSVFKQDDLKDVLRTLDKRHYIVFLAIDHRTHRTGYVQVRIK